MWRGNVSKMAIKRGIYCRNLWFIRGCKADKFSYLAQTTRIKLNLLPSIEAFITSGKTEINKKVGYTLVRTIRIIAWACICPVCAISFYRYEFLLLCIGKVAYPFMLCM